MSLRLWSVSIEHFCVLKESTLQRCREPPYATYYKARMSIRRADGYQRMEEMTIMKMKCTELLDFIANGIGLGPVRIA